MKRWNGWGEESTQYPLPTSSAQYLEAQVGAGLLIPDATFEDILKKVPAPKLPPHSLISTDPEVRARHARGHSMPDWISLRYGTLDTFPDGVAFPNNIEDIRQLMAYARDNQCALIPYGGGTSVVGHINTLSGIPTITVALDKMNKLEVLDRASMLATFGAGIRGPELEQQLNQAGYTLGHFPQSFEWSTLGGWIASRSVGTQCLYYGRIERMFVGGHVETPIGPLDFPVVPASAAGPNLRELFMGSEGRLGFITSATMRIQPIPPKEQFTAVFFPNWEEGCAAAMEIVQAHIPVSMVRLNNPNETETTLQLTGKTQLVNMAHSGLNLIGIREQRCLMIFGVTGTAATARCAHQQASAISRSHHGFVVEPVIGPMWHKSRFTTPYLRNTLWERGYAIDTLETAMPWSNILIAMPKIQQAIQHAAEIFGDKVLVFGHLSHLYTDGASIYITYLFRRTTQPQELYSRWLNMKTAASEQIVAFGGTISHQHGIGLDHASYLAAEKGTLGMKCIKTNLSLFDPDQIMNPGKLISSQENSYVE